MIANTNYVDAFYDNNKELKNKEMKKDKQIHIRVSDSEMTAIKEKSLKNGLTVTDYIKKSCGIVCETSEEVIQREQEELDRFIDSQKEIDKLYSDYYYNPCETLEEQVEIKQKELEEFENFSYCESLEEVRQREQEEMNYPAASCGVSKVATSTYNPICYTALFPLRFYRLFYNFSPAPVLSHTCL